MNDPSEHILEMDLLQWYRHERRGKGSSITICECECRSGAPISERHPDLVRAFLFVASSIDEAMRTPCLLHSRVSVSSSDQGPLARLPAALSTQDYDKFRRDLGFPRIEAHGPEDGFVSPGCLIYDWRGVERLTDWKMCSEVAENLISRVRKWIETLFDSHKVWIRFSDQLQGLVGIFEQHDPEAAARVAAALE